MGDLWERIYFGNLDQTANGDPDGDGFTNGAEHPASDPTLYGVGNAASYASILENNKVSWSSWGSMLWEGAGVGGNTTTLYGGGQTKLSGKTYYWLGPGQESSYLRAELAGPGILEFYWRVSCKQWTANFYFTGNGITALDGLPSSITGEQLWTLRRFSVQPGTQQATWHYYNPSSDRQGDNCGMLDFVRYLPDIDGDSLDDDWEIRFFNTLDKNGSDNPDGDGLNNAAEFAASTNPNVSENVYAKIPKWSMSADAVGYSEAG